MTWRLHHAATTVSTNLDARAGKPGDVFTAAFQSAGRGRLDHKWLSPPGENLMLSAVLDVRGLAPEHLATLPLAVGLAVLRGIESFLRGQAPVEIKWPNDVLVDGKKISGVLCERVGDVVIAGLGVNVGQRRFPQEVAPRATSLALLADAARGTDPGAGMGPVPRVAAVRDAVLAALSAVYDEWRSGGFAAVYPEISAHDFLRGKTLGVLQTDDDISPVRGLCGGIQSDGSLGVGDTRVYAGEAHVLCP